MSHAPPPVSLTMIVRNEQQNLERCLRSVPISSVNSLQLLGSGAEIDTVLVDYAAGYDGIADCFLVLGRKPIRYHHLLHSHE